GITLAPDETQLLAQTFDWLAAEALPQPQVFVHRDYHSRNLMIVPQRSPGVIDFQDALRGPVGYDPVSILKDCYVDWPRSRVEEWLRGYRARLLDGGGAALVGSSDAQFLRWFDLIGLQRHIKVLGIFARLYWRDGKTGYLDDLPRTLAYVQSAARLYPELDAFAGFVDARLAPGLPAANARAQSRPGRPISHQGDAAGRRARRAHAPADRRLPQAAAAGGRQAADPVAPAAPGCRGVARGRHQSFMAGRADRRGAGRWVGAGTAHHLQPRALAGAGDRRRHLPGAAAAGARALPAGEWRCVHRCGFHAHPAGPRESCAAGAGAQSGASPARGFLAGCRRQGVGG